MASRPMPTRANRRLLKESDLEAAIRLQDAVRNSSTPHTLPDLPPPDPAPDDDDSVLAVSQHYQDQLKLDIDKLGKLVVALKTEFISAGLDVFSFDFENPTRACGSRTRRSTPLSGTAVAAAVITTGDEIKHDPALKDVLARQVCGHGVGAGVSGDAADCGPPAFAAAIEVHGAPAVLSARRWCAAAEMDYVRVLLTAVAVGVQCEGDSDDRAFGIEGSTGDGTFCVATIAHAPAEERTTRPRTIECAAPHEVNAQLDAGFQVPAAEFSATQLSVPSVAVQDGPRRACRRSPAVGCGWSAAFRLWHAGGGGICGAFAALHFFCRSGGILIHGGCHAHSSIGYGAAFAWWCPCH
ncbi:hypothetical protein CYMTET_35278 [Cymbomonas tetramitiformis]|uniref:Uncharacterized protein n=1 Tax=Cymbomonas tetramitiformis TaxID=36881 RepID=A0AAE0F9L5_9CHLO|nr:hypothetical protein CYMTET_35278 [Cymbomonas tetramitiformis]